MGFRFGVEVKGLGFQDLGVYRVSEGLTRVLNVIEFLDGFYRVPARFLYGFYKGLSPSRTPSRTSKHGHKWRAGLLLKA